MENTTLDLAGYQCQALYNKGKGGTPIVFLHGLSYDISVWQHVKITDSLTEKKIPFLALDMPYGTKSQCEPKTRDPQANVALVAEATKSIFGDEAPILVGASIGGYIALSYAAKYPVKGLFLVAPAYAFKEMDLALKYPNFHFPVRIVWGSNDTVISSEEMRTLVDKLPNAKLLVYNNAAHSAYQDQPEWFKTDLIKLYATATI
ncbi:MAG TPA: alpha/beta hydrolase [Candidatus Acidoferrales bacterium]|nr:alpha/beta hydrolase [Candidatus Acidoferrales bacterium]